MRRWIPILTLVVAATFAVLAIPGSPVATWLVDILAGGDWRGLTGGDMTTRASLQSQRPVLRAAVGAMVTPKRTYNEYRELFSLVAERTGRRLELIQRKTYGEVNDLIAAGSVDMAWVCTGAIPDLVERRAARLLVVPVVGGRAEYQSYLIVSRTTAATDIEQLRGSVFAFTDPLSLTGRRVVVDLLRQRGQSVENFFSDSFYTHAHDSSIRAVRDGLADAACVDSLVYDYLVHQGSKDVSGTRVIWRSEWLPIPPLVTPSSIDNDLFAQLQRAFLEVHNINAQSCLDKLRVDAFVEGNPKVYSFE